MRAFSAAAFKGTATRGIKMANNVLLRKESDTGQGFDDLFLSFY